MERLKELRQKSNLLQKDVAKAIHVGRSTYVKYENGDSEPNMKTLVLLADFFNVTTDYILGRTNDKHFFKNKKFECSKKEQMLIKAYRSMPEYQLAVDIILGIKNDELISVYQAAHSEDNHPDGFIQMKKKHWDEISDAPETEDTLL